MVGWFRSFDTIQISSTTTQNPLDIKLFELVLGQTWRELLNQTIILVPLSAAVVDR